MVKTYLAKLFISELRLWILKVANQEVKIRTAMIVIGAIQKISHFYGLPFFELE